MRRSEGPIVVLGMHRSGTTLLMRALARSGVWIGHTRDPNDEPHWFLRWNERLLAMAGARWDDPAPWLRLVEDEPLRARLQAWLADAWWRDGAGVRGYLGRRRWLAWRLRGRWPDRWALKDPRVTLTWPVWRALFPRARVVHVVRHGVDVAASLVARERALREQTLTHFPQRAWRVQSVRCWSLSDAFALWERYLGAACRWRRDAPAGTWLDLRYEDLLRDPAREGARMAAFLGLARLSLPPVRVERALAHRRDPELAAFAARCARAPMLTRWYGDD